jgi:Uma2 family endonuclease
VNLPDSALPARALILDRELVRSFYHARTRHGNAPHDEVWAGTLVLYAPPENEHQILRTALTLALHEATGATVLPGANVSGAEVDWLSDFRCPDVVVYLPSNPARDADTHWVGGPDLAVEVVSPGEDPRLKFDFYAKVGTREVLIVDRSPWALELYQLQGGKMVLVGMSDAATSAILTSLALPLTFQLRPGSARPVIHIAHTAPGQTWTA